MFSWLKRGVVAAAISLGMMGAASAQSFPLKFDSAASPNATEVIIGKTQIRSLVLSNSTVTPQWLKVFDTAIQPNCGAPPVSPQFKVMLPSSNSLSIPVPDGLQFQNGVGFCLTPSQSDADASNSPTGITVNFGIKQ